MRELSRLFLDYARLDRRRTGRGLSVKQLERWSELKRRLEQQLAPGASPEGSERRSSLRVPTRLNCTFESIGTLQKAMITNLSRTGMFIATSSALPIGAQLNLCILIEETGEEMQVPAKVVSNNVGPSFDLRRTGMGVPFSRELPELTEQLDDLYEQQIKQAFGDGETGDEPEDPEAVESAEGGSAESE